MEPVIEYNNYRPGYDTEGASRNKAILEYRLKFPDHVSDETHKEIQTALSQLEDIVNTFNDTGNEEPEGIPIED